MKKIIQKYLSQYYYIKTSEIGNDGIHYIFDIRKNPTPVNCLDLINEISKVFAVNFDDSKKEIDEWAIKQKPDINLYFFWLTLDELFECSFLKKIISE